jgi:Na+/H+ antiporter NhaD/arsenite permease-like protein
MLFGDVLAAAAAVPAGETKPTLPMVIIGGVLLATFAFIAFDWLHKTVAALMGAIAAVALGLALGVFAGENPYSAVYDFIHHDLSVIGVIVGTSIVVTIVADSGLFHFTAIKLVKVTRGEPRRLLPAIVTATVAFVTFLTIAPGVLIMASLVLVITESLDDDPKPYIVAVAIAANSGALMTFASGIPTLMIGTAAEIPYLHFLIVSTPLALITAGVGYVVIRFMYRTALKPAADRVARAAKVAQFDEWALVRDRGQFYRCAAILLGTIAGFALAQQIGVGLDYIAFAGATAALLLSGFAPEEAIRKVNWSIIVFFVGLFVLIGTVRETGLLDVLAGQIYALSGDSVLIAIALIIPFTFITAAIVDNIPVAATMIPVIRSMIAAGLPAEPLWWSLIAACNLGGNPTPVGSIASVIALHALERERKIKIGWGEYMKIGGSVAAVQLVIVFIWMAAYYHFELFPALGPVTPPVPLGG